MASPNRHNPSQAKPPESAAPQRGARQSPEGATDYGARSRGAQPGNLNALKHGFYFRHMHADELAELADATVANLNGEVALTRVAARRVLGLLDDAEDDQARVALLNAITMAAMRVASLLKTKKYLTGDGDDMSAALQEALKDVALETQENS